MMPDHVLSTQVILGQYIPPEERDPLKTKDYELGGIALQDPSEGLMYQVWTVRLDINEDTGMGSVYLSAPNTPDTLQFELLGITEVSLAFDQNMNPFIAFVQSGQARFWWYDPTVALQIFTDLPVGARSPKCCLDDKRPLQTELGQSDILLCYINGTTLYLREQRDRYLTEYPLKTGVTQDIIRIAMTDVNRVQIAIGLYDE